MAWTTLSIKDEGGTARTMRVWDESGTGAGPFSFAHRVADGAGEGDTPATQTTLAAIDTKLGATLTVGGTVTANAGSGTFAISAASLPLPSGAATEAKQPALGIAGTASSDVITVQGIAAMTALVVDGSGVTQPVSAASLPLPAGAATQTTLEAVDTKLGGTLTVGGTVTANAGSGTMAVSGPLTDAELRAAAVPVTANAGTNLNTSALALETGGNLAALVTRLGEVQESPTENTVLERLKAVETAIVDATVGDTVALEPGTLKTVAASQTDSTLGAAGATGDYLGHIVIVPATTSPGAVSIKDGAGDAVEMFAGGSDITTVPFSIPINSKSEAGAWSVTTGANVAVRAVGKFTES